MAIGWHLDGRVAAVFGTHTHVPTADARVLPGGTAFISDVGMTGSRTSVLGVKPAQVLEAMNTQMPVRFETAEEDVWVMGAVVEVNCGGSPTRSSRSWSRLHPADRSSGGFGVRHNRQEGLDHTLVRDVAIWLTADEAHLHRRR